jgi:translation initiation factor IF-3
MSRPYYGKKPIKPEPKHRINSAITAQSVRLVAEGFNGAVVSIAEARQAALDAELDLVEISPNTVPPVCKVIDYGKFLYQQKRKDKDNAKNKTEMKELRFSPTISDHDFEVKAKQAVQFLKEGDKVRTSVQFKGRQMAHREQGELVLLKLAKFAEDAGKPEALPKLEGKKMFMLLTPKK